MSPIKEALWQEAVTDNYNTVVNRTSSSIKSLIVNPFRQTAIVIYEGSDALYSYRNVPVFECFRVINTPDISLGFWVNQVLKRSDVLFTKTSFAN